MTVLDIDLDFFTSPIVFAPPSEMTTERPKGTAESINDAFGYLHSHCKIPTGGKTPGAWFEDHDEVFNFALRHFTEPVHLIHVDAHSDIGGEMPMCWHYVFSEYLYFDSPGRRDPRRNNYGLNCGNFIIFLAACGLLEKVTFVPHVDWKTDYVDYYMKDFDLDSGHLQLKRCPSSELQKNGTPVGPWNAKLELESPIPFNRIPRHEYLADSPPDMLLVTRSPQYTPACSDGLYDALVGLIDPLITDHSALSTAP